MENVLFIHVPSNSCKRLNFKVFSISLFGVVRNATKKIVDEKMYFVIMFKVRGGVRALQFYRTTLLYFPLGDEVRSVPENTGVSFKISKRQSGATFNCNS